MISAPQVSEVFNTNTVYITGQFTVEEAKELADLLNAGALPVDLKEVYSTSVGAQFGTRCTRSNRFLLVLSELRLFSYSCLCIIVSLVSLQLSHYAFIFS